MKYFIVILIIFLVGIFITQARVNALELNGDTYHLELDENGILSADINFTIRNNEPQEVVESLDISFPFSQIEQLRVLVNSQTVPISTNSRENQTNILINTLNSNLVPNTTAIINITFVVDTEISTTNDINILEIETHELLNQNFDSKKLSFPTSFGQPTFVLPSSAVIGQDEVNLNGFRDSLILVWGSSYTRSFLVDTEVVRTRNTFNELFHLPLETGDQQIQYSLFDFTGDFGLKDAMQNNFASLRPRTSEVESISIQFDTLKTRSRSNTIEQSSLLNIAWNDIVNELGPGASSIINSPSRLNNYLISNFNISEDRIFNPDELSNFSSRLQNVTELKPFDFAIIIASYFESQNTVYRIVYGYPYFINVGNNVDVLIPHVWVEYQTGNGVEILDPYLSKLHSTNYFGINSAFDRIMFGYWSEEQNYNNVLGLFSHQSDLLTLKEVEQDVLTTSNSVTLDTTEPIYLVSSGLRFDIPLVLQNETTKIHTIDSIALNNQAVHDLLGIGPFQNVLLLPLNRNELTIYNLREPNIFRFDIVNEEIAIATSEGQFLSTQIVIEYNPNMGIIISILTVIAFAGVIFIVSLYLHRLRTYKKTIESI